MRWNERLKRKLNFFLKKEEKNIIIVAFESNISFPKKRFLLYNFDVHCNQSLRAAHNLTD